MADPAPDSDLTVQTLRPGGRVLGRFVLGEQLGEGGMGTIWAARDETLDEVVALKFLNPRLATDPEALNDLKRETARTRRLTHPNIIRIHDLFTDGTVAAVAMELVATEPRPDGMRPPASLAARKLTRPHGCFEPAELAEWVRQLAAALEYAHSEVQVVHRDLKPANLLIDARGQLKVADFGIARSLVDTRSQKVTAGDTSGTPTYMSPQQMMGEPPSAADDIYAVGATLYELLTGKPPFFRGQVQAQVLRAEPVPLAARRAELGHPAPAVPPEWESTILACLAKQPAGRPRTMVEVLKRLGLAGPPIAPPVDSDLTQPANGPAIEEDMPPPRPPADRQAAAGEHPSTHSRPVEAVQPAPATRTRRGPMIGGIAVLILVLAAGGWWLARRPAGASATPTSAGAGASGSSAVSAPAANVPPLANGDRFTGEARLNDGSTLPVALRVDHVDLAAKTIQVRLGDSTPEQAERLFAGRIAYNSTTGRWQLTLTTKAGDARPGRGPFSQSPEGWTIDASIQTDGTIVGASATTEYRFEPVSNDQLHKP